MKVIVSSEIGFCFGVKRAVSMVEKLLKEVNKAFVVGNLIHNPLEMRRLKTMGLVSVERAEDVPPGSFAVIRSHGLRSEEVDILLSRGVRIVDATCPFVKRVRNVAQALIKNGYDVILYGDPEHPEVQGVTSYVKGRIFVVRDRKDLDFISTSDKIGLVSQTTQELSAFVNIAIDLLRKSGELKIINTICDATIRRKKAIIDLFSKSSIILIVGGKNSANTRKLVELSKEHLKKVYHIEFPKEISRGWFEGVDRVGLASGASTPDWQIKAVLAILKKYGGEVCNGNDSDSGKC